MKSVSEVLDTIHLNARNYAVEPEQRTKTLRENYALAVDSFVLGHPDAAHRADRAQQIVWHLLASKVPEAASGVFRRLPKNDLQEPVLRNIAQRIAEETATYGDIAFVKECDIPRTIAVGLREHLPEAKRSVVDIKLTEATILYERKELKKAKTRLTEPLRLAPRSARGSLLRVLLPKTTTQPQRRGQDGPLTYWNEYDAGTDDA